MNKNAFLSLTSASSCLPQDAPAYSLPLLQEVLTAPANRFVFDALPPRQHRSQKIVLPGPTESSRNPGHVLDSHAAASLPQSNTGGLREAMMERYLVFPPFKCGTTTGCNGGRYCGETSASPNKSTFAPGQDGLSLPKAAPQPAAARNRPLSSLGLMEDLAASAVYVPRQRGACVLTKRACGVKSAQDASPPDCYGCASTGIGELCRRRARGGTSPHHQLQEELRWRLKSGNQARPRPAVSAGA